MTLHRTLLATALAAALLPAAQAATYEWSGDTTGAPTYNRLYETLDAPAPFETAVNYETLTFQVDTAGSYDFLSIARAWDNFTFLYSPTFIPDTPLMHVVAGNDDLGLSFSRSGFTQMLAAGTTYVFVTTGFASGIDYGAYSNSITGPGEIALVGVPPIPEPGSIALMALGLGALVATRRRSTAAAR